MNIEKMKNMKFEGTNLQIDFINQKVKYDTYIYSIHKIEKVSHQIKHKCIDNYYYSLNFKHTIFYKKDLYYVYFCNKCKHLFLKEAK